MDMNRSASLLTKVCALLELGVAVVLILAILASGLLLITELGMVLLTKPQTLDLSQALSDALALVVGIEFVKMLIKHTPEAVVEVLLFAIAREMIVFHTSSLETLIGVVAVGVIFVIRKFLCPNALLPKAPWDQGETGGPEQL